MIARLPLTRRKLLAATGLLAGSLFLPSRRGRAQSVAPPKRLIVFFTQHGTVYPNFKMRPNGAVDDVAFTADLNALQLSDFSPILQPLFPIRDKLLVVDNLSMATAEADVTANGHDVGTRHALTGALMSAAAGAGGASIDQLIVPKVRVEGRIDSLELAVIGALNGGAVWRAADQSLPADASANNVFNRVFPPPVTGAASDEDIERAAQPSVLDVVKGEYEFVAPKLSGVDRQKLELHRDLVRAVEQRLVDLANIQCTRPDAPVLDQNGGTAAFYNTRADAMFKLTAAALSCDLTRVVTIQMGQLFTDNIGAPPGDIHAEYAHQWDTNDTAKQFMTTYGNVHAQHFASLLAELDAIPEGNGTLLDSCAVVWVSELADGTHHFRPWWSVIGGGAMTSGKYVAFAKDTPNPSLNTTFPGYSPTIGPPHNKLWLTVAKAVGAELPSVGETSLSTPDGHNVDCTGTFDELL